MRLLIVLFCVFICGCTIQKSVDYIHTDTHQLRKSAIWAYGEVELDSEFALVPDFRAFSKTWGASRRANLWIISKEPITVYIDKIKLSGPRGSPSITRTIDSEIEVIRVLNRETTLSERLASGGFFKGKRLVGTEYFVAKLLLYEPVIEFFNDVDSLDLEVFSSVNGGEITLQKFHLKYHSMTAPGFITR